jgi:hypothetical protein
MGVVEGTPNHLGGEECLRHGMWISGVSSTLCSASIQVQSRGVSLIFCCSFPESGLALILGSCGTLSPVTLLPLICHRLREVGSPLPGGVRCLSRTRGTSLYVVTETTIYPSIRPESKCIFNVPWFHVQINALLGRRNPSTSCPLT